MSSSLGKAQFVCVASACMSVCLVAQEARAESIGQFAKNAAKEAGLFLNKERSFVNLAGSFALYNVHENDTDPVLGLQLSFAPVSFFNIEVGVGGNNNKITAAAWNDGLSYVGAGIVYLASKMMGGSPDFEKTHNRLTIDVRTNPPYKNTALWLGAYVTPLPFSVLQPQFGVHAVKVSVANKGDTLVSYEVTKILPTVGIEIRGDDTFGGFRVHGDTEAKTRFNSATQKEEKYYPASVGFYLGANF